MWNEIWVSAQKPIGDEAEKKQFFIDAAALKIFSLVF